MSLNGLDSDAVLQAYETAVTAAGGWFLLEYASRDTVKILASGSGGVGEARKAVEAYEQISPLYGLAHFRRKKFILKYVPEGTSRLLQARLLVQFQSILDAFTPHDTVFAFTTAEELSESSLSLNTVLKSGSKTSSSSSLRQRRLQEIAEDNEEAPIAEVTTKADTTLHPAETHTDRNDGVAEVLPSTARAKAILAQRRSDALAVTDTATVSQVPVPVPAPDERIDLPPDRGAVTTSPEPVETLPVTHRLPPRTSSISTDKALPEPPAEVESPVSLSKIVSSYQRPSLDFSIPAVESDSDDDLRRPIPKEYHQVRVSSHLTPAESTSISRWTDEVVASTSSKQKRASRLHGETQVRPRTSGAQEDTLASRRVANLPHSVRVPDRRTSTQSSRPGSQQSARSMPVRWVPSPNLPPPLPSPTVPNLPGELPVPNRAMSQTSSYTEAPTVAPEKLRLMKALQMRKRNQLSAQRSASAGPTLPTVFKSIDSTSSTNSRSSGMPSNPIAMVSNSDQPELASISESQTTSPISATVSENQSTKPSSFSEQSPQNDSKESLSSDTNSSTTPKADSEHKQEQEPEKEPEQIPQAQVDVVRTSKLDAAVALEHVSVPAPSNSADMSTNTTLPDAEKQTGTEELVEEDPSDLKIAKKRVPFSGRIFIPPVNTDLSDASEDDDDLMEELQNATVQEAKPMSVNRTPATPVLSRISTRDARDWTPASASGTKSRTPSHSSQVSTPDRRRTTSRTGSVRSLSTALPQWPPTPDEPVPALPKIRPQIAAGIKTRVKAFENLGQKEPSTPISGQKEATSRMTSFSTMVKRASHMPHSQTRELSPQKVSPTGATTAAAEPDEEKSNLNSHPLVQRPGTDPEVYSPTNEGESVTVTARIIRGPIKLHATDSRGESQAMHRSPLIVEHQDSNLPMLPRELTTQSADSLPVSSVTERRRFSFSSHKPSTRAHSPTESKMGRMASSPGRKSGHARSEASSITDEKKGSRTSRLLRRLSGIGSSMSRNKEASLSSPTLTQSHPETINEQKESPDLSMRSVVDIGEVNVQFSDTLLWKRRFLRVDDQGYLIFAPPANDSSSRSRKVHLDELHRPALPDSERQQMAWSIVLDRKDGGSVQCACESREDQWTFLKLLVDAHNAYNQLYTG